MVRYMPGKDITPGYVVVYPNRDKASSKTTKAIVTLIMLVAAALILIVTAGGWSKLQGLKAVNLLMVIIYAVLAFYIFTRWARGLLPIAAGLGVLMLMVAFVAGTGLTGTSWFDRNAFGFAAPHSLFGSRGLGTDELGLITILIAPVSALQIFFAMLGFSQGWNVEMEVPEDEAKRGGGRGDDEERQAPSSEPATA
jgi:lysylphosphatidylglycerol synthetase-like protein (DUF2156 family)